jgi:hypothetical protein
MNVEYDTGEMLMKKGHDILRLASEQRFGRLLVPESPDLA